MLFLKCGHYKQQFIKKNTFEVLLNRKQNTNKFEVLITDLAGIYLFKVNGGNTRAIQEIRQLRRSGDFMINFEQISHIVSVFFVDFEQINTGWVDYTF